MRNRAGSAALLHGQADKRRDERGRQKTPRRLYDMHGEDAADAEGGTRHKRRITRKGNRLFEDIKKKNNEKNLP